VADDITDPAVDVDYELHFLPPADAFYTFKGFLGGKRLLPGRSGPPGADYNTLSAYKPLHRQMIAFHWRDGDADYVKWFGQPERGMDDLTSRFARLLEGRISGLGRKPALITLHGSTARRGRYRHGGHGVFQSYYTDKSIKWRLRIRRCPG
jgi:hypothetical protein